MKTFNEYKNQYSNNWDNENGCVVVSRFYSLPPMGEMIPPVTPREKISGSALTVMAFLQEEASMSKISVFALRFALCRCHGFAAGKASFSRWVWRWGKVACQAMSQGMSVLISAATLL